MVAATATAAVVTAATTATSPGFSALSTFIAAATTLAEGPVFAFGITEKTFTLAAAAASTSRTAVTLVLFIVCAAVSTVIAATVSSSPPTNVGCRFSAAATGDHQALVQPCLLTAVSNIRSSATARASVAGIFRFTDPHVTAPSAAVITAGPALFLALRLSSAANEDAQDLAWVHENPGFNGSARASSVAATHSACDDNLHVRDALGHGEGLGSASIVERDTDFLELMNRVGRRSAGRVVKR
jgi:hypothetical protein